MCNTLTFGTAYQIRGEKQIVHHAMKVFHLRHMEARLMRAAADANVALDPGLTSIERVDERFRIIASCDAFPKTEEERSFMQSAVYVVIIHEFRELQPDDMDVRVIVPHALAPACQTMPCNGLVSEQLIARSECAMLYVVKMVKAAYTEVIDGYAWRDADAMRDSVPFHLQRIVQNLAKFQTHPAMYGNVDDILPPIEGLLPKFDRDVVVHEVTRHLKRLPRTLLELYETAFHLARSGRTQKQVTVLMDLLLQ